MEAGGPVPVRFRVHLAHAVVQTVADECAVDILHIKGPAVSPALRGGPGQGGTGSAEPRPSSVDADFLARPEHFSRLMEGLRRNGWKQVTPLLDHGLVQHSTVWFHPRLGQADLHYRFPGIGVAPSVAFERLWGDRHTMDIAHRPCVVPSVTAQRLLLLLHAARDPIAKWGDVTRVWTSASSACRDQVRSLAWVLRAEVALAVTTGDLEDFRERREYPLWKLYAGGNSSTGGFAKLGALARSAPEGYDNVKLRVVKHAFRVLQHAPQRLAASQTHRPTRQEILREFRTFFTRALDIFPAENRR